MERIKIAISRFYHTFVLLIKTSRYDRNQYLDKRVSHEAE